MFAGQELILKGVPMKKKKSFVKLTIGGKNSKNA
jgi:hypothetical protein